MDGNYCYQCTADADLRVTARGDGQDAAMRWRLCHFCYEEMLDYTIERGRPGIIVVEELKTQREEPVL